jgi:hypothetical protein
LVVEERRHKERKFKDQSLGRYPEMEEHFEPEAEIGSFRLEFKPG